jgi:hypothetical protein
VFAVGFPFVAPEYAVRIDPTVLHILIHLTLFFLGIFLLKIFGPRERETNWKLVQIFVCGYVVRAVVIILLHSFSPNGIFMLDDAEYNRQAVQLCCGQSHPRSLVDIQGEIGSFHIGYSVILGLLYKLAGPSVLSGKLLNAFFGGLVAPLVFGLFRELTTGDIQQQYAITAAWVAALFPYDVAWGAFLLKDAILEFLFAAAILCSVAFFKRRSVLALAGALLAISMAGLFRIFSLGVWAGALGLAGLAYLVRRFAVTRSRRWLLFAAMVVGTGAAVVGSLLLLAERSDFAQLMVKLVTGYMDVSPDVLSLSPSFSGVARLARAVFVFFFSPFPWVFWDVKPLYYIFYPGMLVIYAGFPFFIAGFWRMVRDLEPLKVFVCSSIVVWGAAQIYIFQAGERERVMIDFLFILCGVWAWPLREQVKVKPVYAVLAAVAVGHIMLNVLH